MYIWSKTLLIVNFSQKTAIFRRWNQVGKKNTNEKLKILRVTTSGFKKTQFRFGKTLILVIFDLIFAMKPLTFLKNLKIP